MLGPFSRGSYAVREEKGPRTHHRRIVCPRTANDNPDLATTYYNLASVLVAEGKYIQVIDLYEKVIE